MIPYETPLVGTVVGDKYAVERLIGAGGMGAVYAASQVALGRKVALKVLHPELCSDADLIERFHREASLAASIGHDNICEVTDFGIDRGMPYLVMPLLRGMSLRAVLDEGAIERDRLLDIMRQVLSALDAAHIEGVVHRDLKPDNIFIAKLGDRRDFVKLLDFGISKVLESDSVKKLTQTGTLLGTADYMAPEQARGDNNVDHRLDIYAAGVILYEALTGRRPYVGNSFNEILLKIVTTECPPPNRVCPDIPKALEAVILKAMARDPADRYVGAKEMSEAIDKAVQGTKSQPLPRPAPGKTAPGTVQTDATRTAHPVTAAPRNRRKAVAVVAAFLLAACGALIWTANQPGEPSSAPSKPGPDRTFGAVTVPVSSNPKTVPASEPIPPPPSVSPPPENLAPAPTLQPMPELVDVKPPPETKKKIPPKSQAEKTTIETPSQSTETPGTLPPPPAPLQDPVPPSSVSPSSPPSAAVYTNMSQLKTALREGRISRLQYKTYQAEIRKRRAAEYERLKADYRSGAITKEAYERNVTEVRRKYEGE